MRVEVQSRRRAGGFARTATCALATALALGCGSSTGLLVSEPEEGRDAGMVDGSVAHDAAVDEDASTPSDAGFPIDAAVDAGVDAGDAAVDAMVEPDAGCAGLSFSSPATYDAGCTTYGLRIADLDGDGRDDIAVLELHSGGPTFRDLGVLRNTGGRTFANETTFVDPFTPGRHDLVFADADLDGDLDGFTLAYVVSWVIAFRGVGDGTFEPATWIATGDTSEVLPWTIALGDVDGDAFPDLVIGEVSNDLVTPNDGAIGVMLNQHDGTFAPRVLYPLSATPGPTGGTYFRGAIDVTLADMDNDGSLDVLAVTADAKLAILLNHGDGTFGDPSYVAIGNQGPSGTSPNLAVADFDANGWTDVATTDVFGPALAVSLNEPPGVLGAQIAVIPGEGGTPLAVEPADVDGDGRVDLVTVSGVWLGLGDGTFEPPIPFPPLPDSSLGVFDSGDLDGDGRDDVAFSDPWNCRVLVYYAECP